MSRRDSGERERERAGAPRSLAEASSGFTGRIRDLVGDEGICTRLMEMGFTPGQAVSFVAASPFLDPVAFALRGTIIALRRSEARCVLI